MKHLGKILLLLSLVTLTSCSTVFRTKTQKINVFSNATSSHVKVNDSVYLLPAKIEVLRSKNPLLISYNSNNKNFDTIIRSGKGPVFYLGNLPTIPLLGVGYWVDLTNQKRFKYPKNIFINDKDDLEIQEYKADRYIAKHAITDTVRQNEIRENINNHFASADAKRERRAAREFKKFNPTEGSFRFNIQPPTLFLMGLSNENVNIDTFTNTDGGVSFGLGFDYYYKNNRFISLETSLKGNLFDMFWWPEYDFRAFKYDLSLRKGHRWKRFEVSYGISFVFTDYYYKKPYKYEYPITSYTSDDSRKIYDANYRALGFSSVFNYQLTSVMFVGLRYNPSLYSFRLKGNGFDYEHVVGIDYRIKF